MNMKESGEGRYSNNLLEEQRQLEEQVEMAKTEVTEKVQCSETSMSLLQVVKNRRQPATWTDMSPGTEVALVELTRGSQEYESVTSKVDLRFVDNHAPEKVVRVQNPYLWGCCLLKKAECIDRSSCAVDEKIIYHATGQSNIDSITKNNLDWRRSFRTKFGCGVSFSPSAVYANTWCNWDIGPNGAFIDAKVLVGGIHSGGCGTVLPDEGCDSTVGNRDKVSVKYYDHEFYPEYVVYYSNRHVYFTVY
jgi:hypothetical protein